MQKKRLAQVTSAGAYLGRCIQAGGLVGPVVFREGHLDLQGSLSQLEIVYC